MYTSLWLNRLYFYVICHWWVKTSSKQFLISGLPYCNKPLCLALFRCQRTWQSLLTKSTSQRTSVMGRITRQLKVTRQVRMNRQGHRSSHPSGHGTLSAQSSSKSRTVEPLMNNHPHLRPIFFIDGNLRCINVRSPMTTRQTWPTTMAIWIWKKIFWHKRLVSNPRS